MKELKENASLSERARTRNLFQLNSFVIEKERGVFPDFSHSQTGKEKFYSRLEMRKSMMYGETGFISRE